MLVNRLRGKYHNPGFPADVIETSLTSLTQVGENLLRGNCKFLIINIRLLYNKKSFLLEIDANYARNVRNSYMKAKKEIPTSL